MTGRVLLGVTVLSAWTGVAAAQATGAMRERVAREFLGAISAHDTAVLRRFVEEHFVTSGPDARPAAARAARLAALLFDLGELDVRSVDTSATNEVAAVVQGKRPMSGCASPPSSTNLPPGGFASWVSRPRPIPTLRRRSRATPTS